jgi:hypothetical protein
MNGTQYVGQAYLGTVGTDWQLAGLGDFNGDGKTDILWRHTVTGALYAWLMNGTQYVGQAYLGTVGTQWQN